MSRMAIRVGIVVLVIGIVLFRRFATNDGPPPDDQATRTLHEEALVWDAHNDLVTNHGTNARAVDQPIAGLIRDSKSRGLLDETLVVWSGEFGRTPFAQGGKGRDHNEYGFSLWMAGGGTKPGVTYGATDDWGYKAVDKPLQIHDLHATILHLLGVDHEELTYRYSARDIRLTDVHGSVIKDILL